LTRSSPAQPSILPQRQAGLCRIRIAAVAGDLPAETLGALASLATSYGRGEVRLTPRHEIEIPFVRFSDLETVLGEIRTLELRAQGLLERPNVVACPGADHCSKAYLATKKLCRDIEAFLDAAAGRGERLPRELRIALSGCPNECSHARLNDIGFVGSIVARGAYRRTGFEMFLGGSPHSSAELGEHIAFVRAEDVVATVRDLVEIYAEAAAEGMTFRHLLLERGPEEICERLQKRVSERIWFYDI
jgi:dissimilatory sulfite reductase (desulfoviridin) alpha/beta subunit